MHTHRCKGICFQSCLRTFNEIRVFERVRNALVDILENGVGTQLLTAITLIGFKKVINPISFKPKAVVFGPYAFAKPVVWPNSLCPVFFVKRINSSKNQIVPFALNEGALCGPTFCPRGGPHWKLSIALFKSRDAVALATLRG